MTQFASTLYPRTNPTIKSAPATPEFWNEKNSRRFDAKTEARGDCLVWTAATDGKGYGIFYATPAYKMRSHRVAWMRENGFIPSDVFLDHICRNPSCVRVAHLREVDFKLNRENLSGAYSNSKTGVRGVYLVKRTGRYRAEAQHNGKQYIAGTFATVGEAAQAALDLRNRLFTHNDADRGKAA